MDVVLRATEPVEVKGIQGPEDTRVLMGGETVTLSGDNISVRKLSAEEAAKTAPAAMAPSDDAFSPTNRPNGPMTAGIAPKMPKPMGELEHRVEDGQIVERPVAERGRAEQAGGPRAERVGVTPGPQPVPEERRIDNTASATSDVDDKGRPIARSPEAAKAPANKRRAAAEKAQKSSAKKATKKR